MMTTRPRLQHQRPSFAANYLHLGLPVLALVCVAGMAWLNVAQTARTAAPIELMNVRPTPVAVADPAQPLVSPAPAAAEQAAQSAPTPLTAQSPVQSPTQPQVAQTQVAPTQAENDQPMFNGRPIRKVRTIHMLVTAYSPDERSCGKWADGFTASGYSVWTNGMKLVAADTRILPFGSIISVPGYNGGKPVPVLDRGGAIKGNRLDVLYPTHDIALQWGSRRLSVDVWEYAD